MVSTGDITALPAEVQALVKAHQPYFTVTKEGKVHCDLNGHAFPARANALGAFIK